MAKKVLVRCRLKEARVRTTRDVGRDDKGKLVESNSGFRQFLNHVCYMTMSEAASLVDSRENKKHIDNGLPAMFTYPAGIPVPVDENHEGPLEAPLSGEGLIASNPLQNEAARLMHEEADASADARARAAGSPPAQKVSLTPGISRDDEERARELMRRAPQRSGAAATAMRIENPDIMGDSDMMSSVPTFKDEKAAAENAS